MTEGGSTDEDLVAAAKRGDEVAFDALVRRYTRMMFRVAYRILGDSAEAEDAVQDSWVSAWKSLANFRGDSSASTWLYRVVTNAALAQVRRRKPTVPLDPTDEAVGPLISDRGSGSPEGHVVRTEDAVLGSWCTAPSRRWSLRNAFRWSCASWRG